jgi:hypothetical protein
MNNRLALSAALLVAVLASPLHAATITIINNDGTDEGLNDPTPVVAEGINPGTTLGDQRLFAAQYVADLWGALLASDVEIEVLASWDPLTCEISSAVLGSAGPRRVHANFDFAPLTDTWYPHALANAIAGADLSPSEPGISMAINAALDEGNTDCFGGIDWYYGLDGNAPAGTIDVLPTILHELGHGLGFTSLVNEETGEFLEPSSGPPPLPDIFSRFLRDTETGLDWLDMDDSQRQASAINDPNLVWTGPHVDAAASLFVSEPSAFSSGFLRMHAPDPVQPGSSVSHWTADAAPDLLMEPSSSPDVYDDVDLTIDLFRDLGWQTLEDLIFADGFEP